MQLICLVGPVRVGYAALRILARGLLVQPVNIVQVALVIVIVILVNIVQVVVVLIIVLVPIPVAAVAAVRIAIFQMVV